MSVIDILATAETGAFFANAGKAAGVTAAQARKAIADYAPAIATALKNKAAADPEAFENLLDLIEEGDAAELQQPGALTDSDAIADGTKILSDLYGSTGAAAKALGYGDNAILAAISATSVLAVLSAQNVNTLSDGAAQAANTSGAGRGFFAIIIAAIFKGLMQGAARQLAPKRRRRYTSYVRRRAPTRRKSKRSVGLDDVFREILGNRR